MLVKPRTLEGTRPPADDFALGGILDHVAEVLAQYAELLDQFRAADLARWRSTRP